MMNSDLNIELIPHRNMESILPLVSLLNNGTIANSILSQRLKTMLQMGGYECIGVYDSEELIGICGVWILNKLYNGKHIEPDNVFIKPEYRSRGVGKLMMDFVFQYAKEIGCVCTEVNCYVTNDKGQEFWKQQGYKPMAHHYLMNFEETSNE